MSRNALDVLHERGYVRQVTHEEELHTLLGREAVPFYLGVDPTADSMHVGHFVAVMAAAHLQRMGHRPIILVGGGTAMVGDPSGRTDMRRMLTRGDIARNADAIKKQLAKLIDFSDGKAIMVDNADWLTDLNYLDFLRDIGAHFSVNRMLAAECFKSRMERGLTFLEFNYMLMQSYDFYILYEKYGCKLQIGGDDQWGNILAGTDLVRKKLAGDAYGLTFALLTTAQGQKMGKTAAGALWLDADKTSPYDFYQYWRNIDDADVEKCLALLTFLPMERVRELGALKDAAINQAKEALAFEVTSLIHGQAAARAAQQAARALFGGGGEGDDIPTTVIDGAKLAEGIRVTELMSQAKLTASLSEGRRLIAGGGVLINGEKVVDMEQRVYDKDFPNGELMIKKGKKAFHRIVIQS